MTIIYTSLERIIFQMFGACALERDMFTASTWLHIQRNGFYFKLDPRKFFSAGETMGDLRDIYLSMKMFERGDVIYS